jgi:YebC/PmpR family DNA-binding regulatory protein
MSGHSRWNNIKRKKEKSDSKKGVVFTKIGHELIVAVREGGGADPNSNFRLRDCISKAKSYNVPNENIERIIRKAAGGGESCYESFIYEGYGPGGTAFLVDILTDNHNRTSANIKKYFSKSGGNLGTPGCVSFLFKEKGVIVVKEGSVDEEKLMSDSIEAGASDIQSDDDNFIIITEKSDYESVKKTLESKGYKLFSGEISMIPENFIEIKGELAEKAQKLVDVLENDDDVQNVWCNAEFN